MFHDLITKGCIGLIAVDEVHLVNSWKSFRPAFQYIILKYCMSCPCPVMALTATVTPSVRQQIIRSLGDPLLTIASVDQKNIFYSVHELHFQHIGGYGENSHSTLIAKQIIPFIESKEQRIIIYVDFVKDAAPLAISLRQAGYETCSYHGQKMSAHDKLQSIESWRNGDVKIMVCTTAFGMGIDQPDVEIVMRIGCPPSLESMIQEFGRGGRDGRPAKGILFYHDSDLQHVSFWAKTNHDVLYSNSDSWRFVYANMQGKCRREVILEHFGEVKPALFLAVMFVKNYSKRSIILLKSR